MKKIDVAVDGAAIQLKGADLFPMMDDPDHYVRLVVARRLPIEWLVSMAADTNADVRLEVARRLPGELLVRLRRDPDWRVRFEVARRIAFTDLSGLASDFVRDSDILVREMACSRLSSGPPLEMESSS